MFPVSIGYRHRQVFGFQWINIPEWMLDNLKGNIRRNSIVISICDVLNENLVRHNPTTKCILSQKCSRME